LDSEKSDATEVLSHIGSDEFSEEPFIDLSAFGIPIGGRVYDAMLLSKSFDRLNELLENNWLPRGKHCSIDEIPLY